MTGRERLVVGIGDPLRGDDGAGHAVIDCLAGHLPEGVRLEKHWGEGASLISLWKGHASVILVDAMTGGAPPGTLRWFDGGRLPSPGLFPRSTHRFGLAEALGMARVLGELPGDIAVLGIEGRAFSTGAGLSPEVERAVRAACREILERMG